MILEEFVEQYGNVEMDFVKYYKYTFKMENQSMRLAVHLGGLSYNIYNMPIMPTMLVKDMQCLRCAYLNGARIGDWLDEQI